MIKAIKFRNVKDKRRIIKQEESKNRKIAIKDNKIYSYEKHVNKEMKNFKCKRCKTLFRVVAIADDVRYAICPRCSSKNIDYIEAFEERIFEKQLR